MTKPPTEARAFQCKECGCHCSDQKNLDDHIVGFHTKKFSEEFNEAMATTPTTREVLEEVLRQFSHEYNIMGQTYKTLEQIIARQIEKVG